LVGGPFGSNLGRRDYRSAGIPVVRGQNLATPPHVSFDDCVYVSPDKVVTDLAGNTVAAGDLVFTQRGTLGQVAIMPREPAEAVLSQSQMRLRVDPNRADPWFVYYCVSAEAFAKQINDNAIVSGVPHINLGILGSLRIPLPSLDEQRRIAGVLGALDDLIDANHRIRESVDRDGLDLVLTESGAAPDAWPLITLDRAASTIESGRRPRGGVARIADGVPSIGAESINGLGVFDFAKTKYVPSEFAKGMRAGVLQSRDVLVYKDGGKPGEFRPHVGMFGDGFPFGRMAINEHVFRLRAHEPLTEPYLYFWLSSPASLDRMATLGTGAAVPGLNRAALKSLEVPVPPAASRRELFPVLDALVGAGLAAAREARDTAGVRNELLPLLLSGRVRVDEVAASGRRR
jgi:type I restriction enzyme S subunit